MESADKSADKKESPMVSIEASELMHGREVLLELSESSKDSSSLSEGNGLVTPTPYLCPSMPKVMV
jgi:hypothetical protein